MFPRLPRAFARKFHKTENKRERTIQGQFRIPIPTGARLSQDFPSRVTVGMVLAEKEKNKVLSPVYGVAKVSPEGDAFLIQQDGSWSTKAEFSIPKITAKEFIESLDSGGLYSLDFANLSLAQYLEPLLGSSNVKLVLSPFCRFQHLDFEELIFSECKEAFSAFLEMLNELFPKVQLCNFFGDNKLIYKHPLGFPEYFLSHKLPYDISSAKAALIDKSVVYLGAETIYHLLKRIFYKEPFTKRHLSVFLVDKKGRMDTEPRQYFLTNGQDLQFLLKNVDKEFFAASFESVYDEVEPVQMKELGFFDIYKQFLITFYERKAVRQKPFLCIECMECNYYCPTSANPFQLVKGNSESFLYENCIQCGICTVYCPSGINIRELIRLPRGENA